MVSCALNRSQRHVGASAQSRDELSIVHGHTAESSFGHLPRSEEFFNFGKQLRLGVHVTENNGTCPTMSTRLWDPSLLLRCCGMCNLRDVVNDPDLSPDASPVAHEVYRRMEALGISKKRLAISAGLADTYVHDLFRGRSKNPKSEQLSKLAEALGCTVDDLRHPVGSSGDPEGQKGLDPTSILPLFPDDIALIRLWRFLPKRAKDLVLLRVTELLPPHLRSEGG